MTHLGTLLIPILCTHLPTATFCTETSHQTNTPALSCLPILRRIFDGFTRGNDQVADGSGREEEGFEVES